LIEDQYQIAALAPLNQFSHPSPCGYLSFVECSRELSGGEGSSDLDGLKYPPRKPRKNIRSGHLSNWNSFDCFQGLN
jgi:hypothetical protein